MIVSTDEMPAAFCTMALEFSELLIDINPATVVLPLICNIGLALPSVTELAKFAVSTKLKVPFWIVVEPV